MWLHAQTERSRVWNTNSLLNMMESPSIFILLSRLRTFRLPLGIVPSLFLGALLSGLFLPCQLTQTLLYLHSSSSPFSILLFDKNTKVVPEKQEALRHDPCAVAPPRGVCCPHDDALRTSISA